MVLHRRNLHDYSDHRHRSLRPFTRLAKDAQEKRPNANSTNGHTKKTAAAEMQGAFGYVDSTVRRAFEDIDTDGSGKLSQRELSGALQRLGITVHTEGELYSHMERWDQDEDGRLNLHEFARMIPGVKTSLLGACSEAGSTTHVTRLLETKAGKHQSTRATATADSDSESDIPVLRSDSEQSDS